MEEAMKNSRLPGDLPAARRKRINRLKKAIVITIVAAILIPTILCIVLAIQLGKVSKELSYIKEQHAIVTSSAAESQDVPEDTEAEGKDKDVSVQNGDEMTENTRKVYLTFDDGPSIYTNEILDILAEYDVKATFFVIGQEDEKYTPMYQRIVEEGHSIGMHSYSHKYTEIYASLDSFKEDLEKIHSLIWDKTGVDCTLYRFPGGSSNSVGKKTMQQCIAYLNGEDIVYFDWNISSKDATANGISAEEIIKNSTEELADYSNAVILFHDTSTKGTTVEALPKIIEIIQSMENTEIVPITAISVPVQHIKSE